MTAVLYSLPCHFDKNALKLPLLHFLRLEARQIGHDVSYDVAIVQLCSTPCHC